MARKITINIGEKILEAELNDSSAGRKVSAALPISLSLSRWGDEYYGDCGISIPEDSSARELMEVGEIAYWPPGKAICLFFGPTPASTDARPRAASNVLPIGKITSGISALSSLGARIKATIRLAE
jgi:hypothetical protein